MKDQGATTNSTSRISFKKALASLGFLAILATTAIIAFTSSYSNPDTESRKLTVIEEEATPEEQFKQFVKKYEKVYKSAEEEASKFETFKQNLIQIAEHNSNPTHTFTLGINQFSDLTYQEFEALHIPDSDFFELEEEEGEFLNDHEGPGRFLDDPLVVAPVAWDWRTQNAVGPVKDQGQCGSCWAFASNVAMEGAWAIAKKTYVSFSEQFLVNCAPEEKGCNGGAPARVSNWMKTIKGIPTTTTIPYEGVKNACAADWTEVGKFTDNKVLRMTTEPEIRDMVYSMGPTVVSVKTASVFKSYKEGILQATAELCDPLKPTHAVAIVGYGTDQTTGLDYWIIKNSWGADWGDNGYIKMFRGGNTCGVARLAVAYKA